MIETFEAKDGVHAGDIVNDYITRLANAIEMAGVLPDLAWNDCDFVVYEIEEDE
jgi:hypothetical protein